MSNSEVKKSSVRQTLAVTTYIIILTLLWFWDYLVALEAGFLSAWIAMLIWQTKHDWSKPYDVASRVVKIAFMWIMMGILGFFLFLAIGQLSLMFLFNNNKNDAGEKLQRIANALKEYNTSNKIMPPVASVSSEGKLLLSWRVLLLPYLNEQELYQRFRLDEPWDSPHNLALLPYIPSCYQFPHFARYAPKGHTFFQLFTGSEAFFVLHQQRSLRDLEQADGASNTVIAGIADEPIPWTKPGDLVFDRNIKLRLGTVNGRSPLTLCIWLFGIGQQPNTHERYQSVTADGRMIRLLQNRAHEEIIPFITWNGGEKIDTNSD